MHRSLLTPAPRLLSTPLLAIVAASITLAGASPAWALKLDVRKKYERQLIQWGLKRRGLQIDPSPEGKTIAKVVIEREDIIAPSDPWPGFLNWFHVKTRDYVVRQEILQRPGQGYDAKLIDESERNLRALFILGVVRIVACKHPDPKKVIVLAVTKDLWSLRLNMVYEQTGSLVQVLDFLPTEENFLGRNKRVSAHVRLAQLDLDRFSLRDHLALGQRYFDQRLLGSRLRVLQMFDVIIDGNVPAGGFIGDPADQAARRGADAWSNSRSSGSLAGIFARLRVDRPRIPLSTKWSFSIDGYADIRQRRIYRQLSDGTVALSTVQAPERFACPSGSSGGADCRFNVPRVYDATVLVGSFSLVRSVGEEIKHDFGWGMLVYQIDYTAPDNFPFDKEVRAWYEAAWLPRSEAASAFVLRYGTRPTRFVRLKNIASLGLSENIGIGPTSSVELRLAQNLRTATQTFFEMVASASYTWEWGGDLFTVAADGTWRYQLGIEDSGVGPWVNKKLTTSVRNITPMLWIGRLHARVSLTLREDDLDRGSALFDSSLVRGYPLTNDVGRNVFSANLEFRTKPLNILTAHVGGVVFYDAGSVFGAPTPDAAGDFGFRYRHSVGLGLRALFPQFDRETLRVDFGVPLAAEGRGAVGTWFSFSFGQQF